MELAFLPDLVVVFAAAVVVATASRALRMPSVGGFLLTGVIIGPSALSLVRDQHLVEILAEVGVVALLFTIGLEFSPERLRRLGRPFLIGGGVQSTVTILIAGGVAFALGFEWPDAVFIGFLVTLSSTAIVLKLYGERRELDAPHGRAAVGILLFQDFLLVPMIIVTPVLGGGVGGASVGSFVARFVLGIGVVAALFIVGRFALPRLLHQIARTRIREALLLGAIAVGLGMALLTATFGFSLALGAFLAGILLSESDYSPQVIADILPLRDVFNSLFFISVGMLLSVGFVRDNPALVLSVSGAIVAVKTAICFVAVRLLAYPNRTALLAGASLAQVGEFSFVLIGVGLSNGLLDENVYQVFLASAVLSMLATPLLVAGAPKLAMRLPPAKLAGVESATASEPRDKHVVIVGFGVNGRNLAHVLRQASIPYVVLELNGDTVRRARRDGEPILFGDASRLEILERAGIGKAAVAVFAISDPQAMRRAVRLAAALNPALHIIVRTAQVEEIDAAVENGADDVVAEEFEASIEILARVLGHYDVPANVIEAEAKALRGDGYHMLRQPSSVTPLSDDLVGALAAGTTCVFAVLSGSAAEGKTILETDLRRRTGASIIAVVRDVTSHTNPAPDFRLRAGDRLVLVGSHAQIRGAFEALG
jgi:CPA2 family monovalent cation:H+ antiporter-2